jgi:hypothetical protein
MGARFTRRAESVQFSAFLKSRKNKAFEPIWAEIWMGKSNSLPSAGHYNANYENFQTDLYAQIRHEAFGEDI